MDKVKWRGGSYGELPYVNVGNKIYIIRDIQMYKKYVYMLHWKYPNYEHILHKPKDIFKQLLYAEKVFLRWYRLKHRDPPFRENNRFDSKTVIYTDKALRFKYFVNDEKIVIYDNGVPLDWYYKTMAEAKQKAEPIILEAIKQYEHENQTQLQLEI